MNYIAIGSAIYGNKGAAAMLETLVQRISELDDDAHFSLFSLYPKQDIRQNRIENLEIIPSSPLELSLKIIPLCLLYRLARPLRAWLSRKSLAIRHLSRAHAYVDQCGISFSDGRLFHLLYNICVLIPGLLMQIPVIKSAQAMGPFEKRVNLLAARLFLPRLDSIFARGETTLSYLRSIGLSNLAESTDLAFLFRSETSTSAVCTGLKKSWRTKDKIVGIAPSAVAARKARSVGIDYSCTFAALIDEMQRAGHHVVLFPNSARPDSTSSHNNDLPLCREIHKVLGDSKGCRLVDSELSAAELRDLISACDCLLTSRFHAMVGALAVHTPCIIVGWSHKYLEIMRLFDLSEQVISYRQCDDEQFAEQLISFIASSERYRQRIVERLPSVMALAAEQISHIVEIAKRTKNKSGDPIRT